jgi:hypothetical protein
LQISASFLAGWLVAGSLVVEPRWLTEVVEEEEKRQM